VDNQRICCSWYFVLAYTNKELGFKGMTGFIVPANTPRELKLEKKKKTLANGCSIHEG
jgi:alkylation response protein AidB-like acyl-CoA dehydrogenase